MRINSLFPSIFSPVSKTEGEVLSYVQAVKHIKALIVQHEHAHVKFACHELLLKHKVVITHHEEMLRKNLPLETSNLAQISAEAKQKSKILKKIINVQLARVSQLKKLITESEIKKEKHETHMKNTEYKNQIADATKEINHLLRKDDYDQALAFAKKMVANHKDNQQVLRFFTKVQKLYDKNERKASMHKKSVEESIQLVLSEAGVAVEEKTQVAGEKKPGWFATWRNNKKIQSNHKEEAYKHQKVLSDIEKMLKKSKNMDEINVDNIQDSHLSVIRSGLQKVISTFELPGFDFYGKIIGKDKITGDTFGYATQWDSVIFYFGDATGHGIQSGLTVALLSQIFYNLVPKKLSLSDLFMEMNNELKSKIKSRYFITAVLFEWNTKNHTMQFIGAGHEPIYIYRKQAGIMDQIIPGGLPIGVRLINNSESIKVRPLAFDLDDVLIGFTDGLLEIKDAQGAALKQEALQKIFLDTAKRFRMPEKIYSTILDQVKAFNGTDFSDDVSLFVFARNTEKDKIADVNELEAFLQERNVQKDDMKRVNAKNKTRKQIADALKQEQHRRHIEIRLWRLKKLYDLGEFVKLKQEIIACYREGLTHEKMKRYLSKAIQKEESSIIKKKEDRLQKKYTTLLNLYNKWEYDVVIQEGTNIIIKNGKI